MISNCLFYGRGQGSVVATVNRLQAETPRNCDYTAGRCKTSLLLQGVQTRSGAYYSTDTEGSFLVDKAAKTAPTTQVHLMKMLRIIGATTPLPYVPGNFNFALFFLPYVLQFL
jgi:hypothetical protein